jgi:hypothetical protein
MKRFRSFSLAICAVLLSSFASADLVVNQNEALAASLAQPKLHLSNRRLRNQGRRLGIINGNTLGLIMGGTGVAMANKDSGIRKRKLNSTLNMVKSQFYRAQVLSQRNKQLYKDMDSILVNLEDKIEDMGDDVYQKLSDFDNSIKSRLSGRAFLPSFSSLH